jgi:hypothetical protein
LEAASKGAASFFHGWALRGCRASKGSDASNDAGMFDDFMVKVRALQELS